MLLGLGSFDDWRAELARVAGLGMYLSRESERMSAGSYYFS